MSEQPGWAAARLAQELEDAGHGDLAATLRRRIDPDAATQPLVSVVIPVMNEEDALPVLAEQLVPVLGAVGDFEIVFVDDGSVDRSRELILKLRAEDPRIKLVAFSRNFGHQAALSAGLDAARGQAVVFMDCDLQDPPSVVPLLVDKWREGFEVVHAVRRQRDDGPIKRLTAYAYYRILGAVADVEIPADSGDFCLLDRRAADALRSLPERNRYLRGLRSWIGFRQARVDYERPQRVAGETKYTARKMVRLAIDGVLAFSSAPLRLATVLGFMVGAAGVLYLGIAVGAKLFVGHIPSGWTSIIALMLVLGGAQLLVVGVLGQYMARVYDETKQRPIYVVGERHGVDG
jgi:dolichol-phosphate mannosyltransferase